MRKRAWVSWMLIIAMMTALWPAAVGYALERPVVYPERNDGRESEYIGETERVRVYDNGEKKKVQVMTVPVDEVQALVWRPVSGASYYLYSIRDVDNDEPVIVNEQMTNYWINLADMLDWDGPLEYGVTYKIAAAACTSPDDCYWSSEPFYFRLVETVQPEEEEEEEEDPQEEYQGGNNPPPTVRGSHSSTEDQPIPTPNDDDWTTELKTPEPEVQLTGGFAMQSIEIQLGETAGLDGWVHCENGLLERVTYLITDHPVEGDPNNRQYSAELGNVSDVDLATTGELILDTNRAPLNEPGHYQIELYARAVGMEQGVWLANVQVHVYAGEETETHPTPEDNTQPTIDSGHSPTPTPYCVMPAPIVMKADVLNKDIWVKLGETARIEGWVTCEGGLLDRVTYLITDHPVEGDPNNRQYSAALGNVSELDLADANELILDTNRTPLNVPGDYQIEVYAKAVGEEKGVQLEKVQVHVYAEEQSAPTDNSHSPTPTPAPAPQAELKADIMNSSIAVKLGDTARIEGWVTCKGGQLERVTYLITDHPVEGDPNNRQYSAVLGNVSELDLAEADELILDTNRTPLNAPGDYQIEVYAKAVGMEQGVRLANVQVHVYAEESGVTQAPVTAVPVTAVPVTAVPVTAAPVTAAPLIQPPVTEAPVTEVELKANVMDNNIAVKLGDTARIEGWVTCKGGQLDRVTYLITGHPVEGDPNNRQYSAVLGNVSELDLAETEELILDTNRTPLNAPGDYQIEVYAKAVGMEKGVRLANVQVHVVDNKTVNGGASASGKHPADDSSMSAEYKNSIFYKNLKEVNLSGDLAKDIVAVAKSQIGYRESDRIDGTGVPNDNNHVEYNHFYGDDKGNSWCAYFVCWCAGRAGVPDKVIKLNSYAVPFWLAPNAKEIALFLSKEEIISHTSDGLMERMQRYLIQDNVKYYADDRSKFVPQEGDLIFFHTSNKKANWGHVGIVTGCSGNMVYFIDGNNNGNGVPKDGTANVKGKVYERMVDYTKPGNSVIAIARPNYTANSD